MKSKIKLTRGQRYVLSILSGLLMALSFPYTGSLYPLIFVAWIPLLLVEHKIYKEQLKSSSVFLHAYITFLIYNVGASYWIYYSIGGEAAAILAYLLNSLIMAFVFLLFHWFKKRIGQRIGQFSLLVFWVGFEFIHFHWELSWPWLNMGNIFSIAPQFVQWYSYTGILGGTLWILLVNLLLFLAFSRLIFDRQTFGKQKYIFLSGLLFIILPALFSYLSYTNFQESKHPIQVVVTQPNIDPYNVKFSASVISQLKRFVDPADSLITDSTAIVLAPETAIPSPFLERDFSQDAGILFLEHHQANWGKTALLVGASTQKVFNHYNSIASKPIPGTNKFYENYNTALLMRNGRRPQFVHKSKLVLGVEKIPFTKWFPFLEKLSIKNGGTSGTLGTEKVPPVMRTNHFIFAPVVCYGSIYGDFVATQCRKGAQVIFVITNDGWWGNSPGYKQHASFARLRAVETHRYVAQSANTGISCIINERGDVVKATDYWVQDAFRATVQLNSEKTFYVTYGDWLGKIAVFLFFAFSAFLIFHIIFNSLRKKRVSPPA